MRAWIILGTVLVLLFLVSLVRVGGVLEYSAQGLLVRIRLGRLRLTVFPMRKRARKPRPPQEKNPQPEGQREKPPKKGGTLSRVKEFLPLAAETAGRFKRKVRIDQLELELTAAASNPAAAAMAFGGANAALCMMLPLLENHFNVRQRSIRTAVDFEGSRPVIYLKAAFSLTIGQGVVLAVRLGFQALRILSQYKSGQKQKEAV